MLSHCELTFYNYKIFLNNFCHAPCLEIYFSLLNIVKLKQVIISYDEGIPNNFKEFMSVNYSKLIANIKIKELAVKTDTNV